MNTSNEFKPAKGVYAIHHHKGSSDEGTLVLIDDESETNTRGIVFSILYMPNGGASFWWEASEFSPVTDPHQIAICKKHAAEQKLKELKKETISTEAEIVKWSGVLEVFNEAEKRNKESAG